VEHSKGKGGERAIAIPRFQGGSPPPMSIKDSSSSHIAIDSGDDDHFTKTCTTK
jgi:hypothetical protein